MKLLAASKTALHSNAIVELFFCGKSLYINSVDMAEQTTKKLSTGIKRMCLVHPASDHTDRGFQHVEHFQPNTAVHTDSLILKQSGDCAVMQVAGCATVTFINPVSGLVSLTHAGRPALTPTCIGTWRTSISNTLSEMGFKTGDTVPEHLFALVTQPAPASKLRYDENPALVEHFVTLQKQFPDYQLVNQKHHTLDLFAVIQCILIEMYRFTPANVILYDIPEPTLSREVAFRRNPQDKGLHNTVVVVR